MLNGNRKSVIIEAFACDLINKRWTQRVLGQIEEELFSGRILKIGNEITQIMEEVLDEEVH